MLSEGVYGTDRLMLERLGVGGAMLWTSNMPRYITFIHQPLVGTNELAYRPIEGGCYSMWQRMERSSLL